MGVKVNEWIEYKGYYIPNNMRSILNDVYIEKDVVNIYLTKEELQEYIAIFETLINKNRVRKNAASFVKGWKRNLSDLKERLGKMDRL